MLKEIESHPLRPFVDENTRLLMLGSFPPPRAKWSMDFYYPNMQNDMWRIFGVVFFGDKDHFLEDITDEVSGKCRQRFSKERISGFLRSKGIGLSDTAHSIVREKGNASDKFLQVVERLDLDSILSDCPQCRTIVTTGEKACETLAALTGSNTVGVGKFEDVEMNGRRFRHYRMPSSSRAYPLSMAKKAEAYAAMFRAEGFL